MEQTVQTLGAVAKAAASTASTTTGGAYTPPPDRVHGVMIMRYFDHGNVYETGPINHPYRENLPQAEREMVAKYGLDPTKIFLAGTPLNEVPHGFVCLWGTKQDMELLVTRYQAEFEDSQASAIENVLDLDEDNADYGEKVKDHSRDEERKDPHALWDIRLKAASMQVPVGHYIFSIFEKGKWTIPGGKRMLGETSKQCAQRELQEETGFQITIPSDAAAHHHREMKAVIFTFRPRLFLLSLRGF
jgi:hypothetical protein